jgi:hypothetical protein
MAAAREWFMAGLGDACHHRFWIDPWPGPLRIPCDRQGRFVATATPGFRRTARNQCQERFGFPSFQPELAGHLPLQRA